MTIYELITEIQNQGMDFTYPPSKSIQSRWVRVDGKKVGYYNSMKTDKGEGLHFRFESNEMALIMNFVAAELSAEVYLNEKLKSVILYPQQKRRVIISEV